MDSRKAAETVVKKPFYACVGLGDLALSRASALPAEARAVAKALPVEARARVRSLQDRAGTLLSPAAVRGAADIYTDQAGHAFSHFADRGEQVIARVRRSPQVRTAEARAESAFDRVDDVTDQAVDQIAEATEQVVKAEAKATTSARKNARRATARKSAPRKKA